MLSEKIRRFGKAGMMAGFGFVVFAIVFYVTLPYVRFKDQIAGLVASAGYDMEAKQAGPSLGGGMTLKEVTLVSPATATSKATRILIDRATLSVSLLSRIFGTKAYGVSAEVFGGDIDATVKTSKDASVEVRASAIDLAETPWVKNATNLPLAGKLDLKVELELPKQRPSEAKGTLSWACTSCALGDGKAKLIIPGNPLLAEGLGLPKIRLGDFAGKIVVDKGVGRLQNVQIKSQDIELSVEGEIHLAQPLAMSHVDLYIRFKLSDSMLRSSEKLRTIMDFTAQLGKRPDGFLGFRATGTFQNMSNVQWSKTSPFNSPATPPPAKPAPPPHPAALAPAPPPAAMPVPPPPPPVAVLAPTPPPPPPPPAPIIAPSAPTPAPMPMGPVAHGVGPSPPTTSPPTTEPAAVPPTPPAPPAAPAAATATPTAPAPATPPVPSTAPSPVPSSAPATAAPLAPGTAPPPFPPAHGGPPPTPPTDDEPK